jgi:ribokinase
LFITEGELTFLTGLALTGAIPLVQSTGVRIIVVKRKGAGATIYQGAETWDLKARVIKAKDTTGAGDVFAAGFLAGLLNGLSLIHCGRLGLVAAHKSMTGLGREAYPDAQFFEEAITTITKL